MNAFERILARSGGMMPWEIGAEKARQVFQRENKRPVFKLTEAVGLKTVGYSSLRYNTVAGRYVNSRGQFISDSDVRKIIDADIEATKGRMRALAVDLRARKIDLETFRGGMASELKNLHLANSAVGVGGIHNMGPEEYGRAGQRLREQYDYLNNFTKELSDNPDLITERVPGKMDLLERTELYAESGRNTYERQRHAEMKQLGYTHEKSVRGSTDSCSECIAAEAAGKVPIGTLPMPGDRICGPACKCELEYSIEANE